MYKRVLGEFKNIPKKIRDTLTEAQKKERNDVMVILNMNLALCHMRRNKPLEAIRHAKDALELDPDDSKTMYRLAQAYKLNNDLDMAKETLVNAAKKHPNNKVIRKEYEDVVALKSKKEKEWYSKMNGFFDSKKLKQIEKKDEEDAKLMHKIKRRCFERREDAPPDDEEEED